MKTNKIMQAVEYFESNYNDDVTIVNIIDDNKIELNDIEFLIVDEEEREEIFAEYQVNLIDDLGLNAFTPEGRQYIIDNCLDVEEIENYRNECNENYIESIRDEAPQNDEEFESRLDEEINENGLSNEDEYLELLNGNDTPTQWYINEFGIDDLNDFIKLNDLLDLDKIIEYIIEVDGYANSLASYNGEEIETDNYYMYRTN